MPKKDARLQLRGSTWHVRVKVPEPLRAAGLIHVREFRKSLQTGSLAEARRLLPLELVRINAEIAAARRRLSPSPAVTLTRAEMDHLVRDWFHRKEKVYRSAKTPFEDDAERREAEEDNLYWEAAFERDDEDAARNCSRVVGELLAASGFAVTSETFSKPEARYLYEQVRRAQMESTRRHLRRLRSDFSEHRGDALFQDVDADQPPTPVQRVAQGPTLAKLIEAHNAEPSRKTLSPKSRLKAAAQERLFKEVIGPEKPVTDIRRTDAAALVDLLLKLPPNATKRFPKLTSQEAAQAAAAAGISPMTRMTARSYLSAFSSLMEFAVTRGWRMDNPAARLSVGSDGVAAKDRRHPFNTDQLGRIFNAPLYRGCVEDGLGYARPGPQVIRRGRFWVPLISLFSGMRMNEICQLHVDDLTEMDGAHVILVQADEDGIKRIKTAAGTRYVPIHPELKRSGLLAYHAEMRSTGEKRLFPELTSARTSGYLSDNFSKWFANFLASAGAKRPRTSFHSFRHTYRDALREADISAERVRALGGWSSGRTEDDYGSGLRASTLAQEIAKVVIHGLDVTHLYISEV